MRIRKYRYYMCDLETTVYEGQECTEAWLAGCVELGTEDCHVFGSLGELLTFFKHTGSNVVAYFHNLKFDGSYILDLLMRSSYKQAFMKDPDSPEFGGEWMKEKDMPANTFKYSISDRGQWYTITLKTSKNIIEFRDSLKLLPMTVERIGKAFSKYRKLDMEYSGFRYAGCPVTEEEKDYFKNDLLIPKEALEYMQSENHTKLTIGSCCLDEFKNIVGKETYDTMFPDLTQVDCPLPIIDLFDTDRTPAVSADEYIRKAYRGGWVYLVPGKAKKVLGPGLTADWNSLYPSVMLGESGNEYPIGLPKWWKGNYIPEEATRPHTYYYVRIRTMFHVKHGKLPFIQIKGSFLYKGTECLESSDVRGKRMVDWFGETVKTRVTLTLTMTDYKLFLEHYNVEEFEILDGCYFGALSGLFDEYINKYAEIKQNSEGAKRELAKLFLNNLYGKLASNDNSSFKYCYLDEGKNLKFLPVEAHNKKAGHIASGAAVTSYARYATITHAQKNYHGPDKPGFCYADTDSIHCDLEDESQLIDIRIHHSKFLHWKIESHWDQGFFTRQKTYIEHVTATDKGECKPYYDIKCAGMTKNCKELLIKSFHGITGSSEGDSIELRKLADSLEGQEFLKVKRTMEDFVPGLRVPGKLSPVRMRGGVVLTQQEYQMH